ncbi:MAG: diphthamide synthesis protein, partial [Candidatus Woesearchaeota archaeon]
RVAQMITAEGAGSVCIQLPDGLKPHAGTIADELERTGAEIFIWFGSCFGACDVPNLDVDLLIQWGHSPW